MGTHLYSLKSNLQINMNHELIRSNVLKVCKTYPHQYIDRKCFRLLYEEINNEPLARPENKCSFSEYIEFLDIDGLSIKDGKVFYNKLPTTSDIQTTVMRLALQIEDGKILQNFDELTSQIILKFGNTDAKVKIDQI